MNKQGITKTQKIHKPVGAFKEPLRKRLLSVQEASIYIGRSIPALRELIWAGRLPIVKTDRRIFLDVLDLDKWIDQNKTRYTD